MRIVILLCALVFAAPAIADVANGLPRFDWTPPTTWTDGTALTASQITGYQLVCSGAATVNKRIAPAGVPPHTLPSTERLGPGSYACTLAVHAKQTATSVEATSSASSPVNFTVPQPKPGVATGFSVD